MNTLDIDRLLFNDPPTAPHFLGTLAADQLPKVRPSATPFYICCNTKSSSSPGEHWLALCSLDGTTLLWFDSFGRGVPRTGHLKRFASLFPVVCYNAVKHQNDKTEVCGGYVILVISLLARGLTFLEIMQIFEKTRDDDSLIVVYLRDFFNYSV